MDWYKANKILDDVFIIIAIIIFPLWLLKILGFSEAVKRGGNKDESKDRR